MRNDSRDHPIREFFRTLIQKSMKKTFDYSDEEIEIYLTELVLRFMHTDSSSLKTPWGKIDDLIQMVYAGDIRLGAKTFEQEREINKHIGDVILFWKGVFPEHLKLLKKKGRAAGFINHVRLGKGCYYVVSTFEHGKYARESAMFRHMSMAYEQYIHTLSYVRQTFDKQSINKLS
jgi:hypothetical protein